MKILSPINKVDEIEKVIKAGAKEIYTGVLSKNWLRTYSHAGTINGAPSRFNNKLLKEILKCQKPPITDG